MKRLIDVGFHGVHLGLLRGVSLLVPSDQRSEWWHEWSAELWHVRRACVPIGAFSWQAQCEVTAFCLGSFQDAYFLHSHSGRSRTEAVPIHGSAAQCILWLSTVLVLCALLARLLPGVRAECDVARYQVSPGLILIEDANSGDSSVPTISAAQFRDWKSRRRRYFDGFAFYRNVRARVVGGTNGTSGWNVAHASHNLFTLLGLPVQLKAARREDRDIPSVVLSHDVWIREFGGDPQIGGRLIRLDKRTARIVGVLPYGSWRLPGQPDAWVLEPDPQVATESAFDGAGFVIAHLTPMGQSEMVGDRVPIASRGSDDSDDDLYGVSFANRVLGPWSIFKFALFLALLALPAITSVSMGESNFSSHRPSWKKRLNRWIFLGAKVALVSSIGYFASLDLAYWNSITYSPFGEFVQLVSSFTISLFGLRWALFDQRQRCPVCLRRVTHPAQVGLASRTFLGWNGTEMICMGGHTLLHVPSLPTSWFSSQRWLYLDASWEFLFAGSGM